jgi:hypothetical protein
MELNYENGQIVSVRIQNTVLQSKLTDAEKMAFFACDHPNLTVWQNIEWLETDARNQDGTPKTTLQLTVQSMVTEGLITQQRADEILS